jgi:hypothetical protein
MCIGKDREERDGSPSDIIIPAFVWPEWKNHKRRELE